jgi:uncharacterized protein (TIGR02757 family)
LASGLEQLYQEAALRERVARDPVELPHRYHRREDVELVALLCASLAYGRVEGFKPRLESLLAKMGDSPARLAMTMTPTQAAELLHGFIYRFNVATDVAILLSGAGRLLAEEGTLEGPLARAWQKTGDLHSALSAFTQALRKGSWAQLRPERGLDHLVPSPLGPGAAKRLNLFLRWMVRGPDEVDFGLWKQLPSSALVIPLDTHVHRMARHLGLTRRNELSWKTALEVTRGLAQIDPNDPVRFDFALCHFGMSGRCPLALSATHCADCALLEVCGSRIARQARRAKIAGVAKT